MRTAGRLAAAVAALLATARAADVCSATPEKLVTSCGGVCSAYMPCSVYNASSSCSGCEDGSGSGSDGDACSYFCFSPYEEQSSELVFFVPFGTYESEEEAAARALDGGYDSALDAFTADYKDYAYSGNDIMGAMGVLALNPVTTSFKLIGGSSSTGSLKSKVALLAFDDGFLAAMSNMTAVTLRNFNLKSVADELPELLPSPLADLTLVNSLLYAMPAGLSSFAALASLTMDMNYVTSVDADDAMESLTTLSLAQNNITSFDAVFPSLETLDLSDNNLTAIPASIYEHTRLTSLVLSGNPLTEAEFSAEQVAFLQSLTSLTLTNDDFGAGLPCASTNYVIIHSVTVCLLSSSSSSYSSSSSSDASESATTASGSSHTSAIVGGVVGGVAAVVVVVLLAYCWLRRRKLSDDGKHATATPPPGHYSATGMSKTAMAASGMTDGTNGGFVSLWVDPELLAVQVKADDIEDLHKIGGGAFGEVWLVRYRGSQLLASKRLRRDQLTRDRTLAFVDEIKLIATLEHPKIVRFVGAAWSIESDLQALSEYMENGDLRSYLVAPSAPHAWSALKLQLAIDVAEALVYVHSFLPPLVHRDLKSRNILLSSDMQAKLTDFGSTRVKSEDNTMTQGVGTGRWLAPEVLAGSQDYGPAADVFAFGVVLSELDSHAIPYDDARGSNGNALVEVAVLQMVALGQLRPSFGADCPPAVRELADRCLSHEPADRPSAPEAAYALRTALNQLFPATVFV